MPTLRMRISLTVAWSYAFIMLQGSSSLLVLKTMGRWGHLVRAGRPWGVCALAGELLAAKWEQCAASRATDVTSL